MKDLELFNDCHAVPERGMRGRQFGSETAVDPLDSATLAVAAESVARPREQSVSKIPELVHVTF